MLALYAWISVGLMHDWLAWNAARWELGRQALAQGIATTDIEGGFEWDGWYACADRTTPGWSPPRIRSLKTEAACRCLSTLRRFPE